MRWLAALTLLGSFGCGEDLVEPGRMRLTPGMEPDPWTVGPTPSHALVQKESQTGELAELGTHEVPLADFSLGRGGAGNYSVTGLDDGGLARVRARSLLIDPAGFAGAILPLFVSRAGQLARPPGELATEVGSAPLAATVASRHLLLASGGGDSIALDGYDLAAWRPIEPPPLLSCGASDCTPRSLAVVQGSLALAIGDGWGFWFDPVVGDSGSVKEPVGLDSFAAVAGGVAVAAPDGSVYVIGGTRRDTPSSSVLAIAADGALSYLALSSPRQGAAAAWVSGRGLLVVGGGGSTAGGAELLAEGGKAFAPLAHPPDTSQGAALLPLDSTRVLRVGGRVGATPAPSVELDLGCATSCEPKPAGDAVDLVATSAFDLGESRALVVGSNDAGETLVFRWEAGTTSSVPLREPRRLATSIRLPTGHVGIAGGTLLDGSAARSVELYLE